MERPTSCTDTGKLLPTPVVATEIVRSALARTDDPTLPDRDASSAEMAVRERLKRELAEATDIPRLQELDARADSLRGYSRRTSKGLKRQTAYRSMEMAKIPEDVVQAYFDTTKANEKELTTAGLLRFAKATRPVDVVVEPPRSTCRAKGLQVLIDNDKHFPTIFAAPPWVRTHHTKHESLGEPHPPMRVEELVALPVPKVTDHEAHLLFLAPDEQLFGAKDVLKAWGFEFSGSFVWLQQEQKLRQHWNVAHSYMVLGVKRGLPFKDHSRKSWAKLAPQQNDTAAESIRKLIEVVSPGPFLELFGNEEVEGWTACVPTIDCGESGS